MLLAVVENHLIRNVVRMLIVLSFVCLPQAKADGSPTIEQRIQNLATVSSDMLEQARSIQEFLEGNPLPEGASEDDRRRYRDLRILKNSYEERGQNLQRLSERLTQIAGQENLSDQNRRGLEGIIAQVEGEISTKTLPAPDLSAPTVAAAPKVEVRETTGDTVVFTAPPAVEVSELPPIPVVRKEEEVERTPAEEEAARQRKLQEDFGDIEYEIERRQRANAEAQRQRKLQEEFGDIEYEIERRQQAEREADRQRKLQEDFGDLEYVWDQSIRTPEAPAETEEERTIRQGNEAFGDLEYQWTQSLQGASVSDDIETTTLPAAPEYTGRSRVDPFLGSSPPYAARPGQMWVRDAETNRWQIITEEEFIERQRQNLREEYSQALGRKLPVNKSIYVYNLNTGREILLNARKDYEIQVSGFGPRNSIRVNVFDKDGNQIPGDFITLASNVTQGTEALAAQEALSALEKIRAAGDIQKYCRPGQVTDPDTGVIPPEQDEDDSPGQVDTSGYKAGCEALADGVNSSDRNSLKQCMSSILSYVNQGNNRCEQLQRMFSLKEAEQDFAALLMATKGEAPGGLPGGSADHLMIMKSLQNRREAVKRIGWVTPLSIMDIAMQPLQYSMFNDWNKDGRFDAPAFLNDRGYDKLVDSFISYQTADWQPPGDIDMITHYYSPPAMRPRNSAPWWIRSPHRKSTAREITSSIRVNGQPVVNSSNSSSGYHRFYRGVDGRNSYSAIRRSRGYIINKCRETAGLR